MKGARVAAQAASHPAFVTLCPRWAHTHAIQPIDEPGSRQLCEAGACPTVWPLRTHSRGGQWYAREWVQCSGGGCLQYMRVYPAVLTPVCAAMCNVIASIDFKTQTGRTNRGQYGRIHPHVLQAPTLPAPAGVSCRTDPCSQPTQSGTNPARPAGAEPSGSAGTKPAGPLQNQTGSPPPG